MTTICPHCQAPMPPASDGAARCPNCGYMVLPQRARTCPLCQKLTLASADHCQHCGAMLPPERETATKQDAKQEHARPQWKNIIRLTLLATFLAVCAVGLKNYVQDKRQQRKETEEQILLQDFVMRLNALQKHQFILRTKITGMPVSDEQLIIYRKNLDETMIPMCERLIQDYHSLPLEAKKLILKPDGRKLEEEQLEQALKQTLQQLRNTSQALEAETLKRTMEKNPQPIQAI